MYINARDSNDIHEIPRKIIRKGMSSIENNTIIGSNDVSLIRKSMYYERKKHLTTLSITLDDALNFVSNCNILNCKNENLTYVYKQDKITIVSPKKYIEYLCKHCDKYMQGGTRI
jgi:hypothetical protein